MYIRPAATAALLGASLVVPATPGNAADPTARVTWAVFSGYTELVRSGPGTPARLRGVSTSCTVAGHLSGVPFVLPCRFEFTTGAAPVSSGCSAAWVHYSELNFVLPTGGTSGIFYDPTVTAVTEGSGSGGGINGFYGGSVHYTLASTCLGEGGTGTLAGHANGV